MNISSNNRLEKRQLSESSQPKGRWQRMLTVFLGSLAAILLILPGNAGAFAGGDGSADDPFQIATPEHLNDIRNDPGAFYILVADIDLDVEPYNTGQGWEPIGTQESPFTGVLFGEGFEIRNLFIGRSSADGVGLFGHTRTGEEDSGAVVLSLKLVDVDVTGESHVGGVVGDAGDGVIIFDVHVSGSVHGTSWRVGCLGGRIRSDSVVIFSSSSCDASADTSRVGGIAGELEGSSVLIGSHSTGTVTSAGNYAGGLVGETEDDSIIIRSWSSSDVSGTQYVGGLVGRAENNSVALEVFATGTVTGLEDVGGLFGTLRNETNLIVSYARGDVSGNERVGGLVGSFNSTEMIANSYATGAVTGSLMTGGLIGETSGEGSVMNSFWDKETSNQADSAGGTGKTTAEMKDIATFNDPDATEGLDTPWSIVEGWSMPFQDTWGICKAANNGYPFFMWQFEKNPCHISLPGMLMLLLDDE